MPPRSLATRSAEPELMDVELVTHSDLSACLRDLARINVASLGYRPTLRWLERVCRPGERLTILDVGSGYGDALRRIALWARRRGIEVDLCGIDANPAATRAAEQATPPDMPIRFATGRLFDWEPDRRFDIVLSSLFAHHLSDADLVRFIRWMEQHAGRGWFVNDLHRHAVPHAALRLIFGVAPVHRFVRHDGPVSVRRGFRRDDLLGAVEDAGLARGDVDLAWHWPFRWGLGRVKGAP